MSGARSWKAAAVTAALLALAAAPVAHGDVDRTKPPGLGEPPALHLPPVQVQTLPNGLELAVVEMHKTPVVDVTLLVPAGSAYDPADVPGLATFTADMLDEGAGTRGSLEIAEQADFLGAAFETGAGPEMGEVHLHVTRRNLPSGLDLMADVVLRPTFPDSEVARRRELRRTALLQLRDQPTQIAPLAFNSIVFGPTHPYGRPPDGNEMSVAKLDRAAVLAFWTAHYVPNRARLLVVGDITPADARALVLARFGAWAKGAAPALPEAPAAAAGARTLYLIDKPGAAQSVIRIGQIGVARSTPDYAALEVLNTLLGGSFTSRLMQNLRETHGYTYGASSRFDMRHGTGTFSASASVVTAKTDSSLIEFLKELRRVRDEAVPAAELEKTRSFMTLGLPGEFETTAGAAARFAELLRFDLPLDTWQRYVPAVRAVTAADVQRVARQVLDPDHFAIVVVGDRATIENGMRALHEGPISLRDLWGAAAP